MEQETVVDAIAILDGGNYGFFTYLKHEEAIRIQECGLANAEQINLREVPQRPVPDHVKQGLSIISDIWVKLEPNTTIYIN